MNRAAAVCLALVLSTGLVNAQGGSASARREPAAANRWIFSETMSPLDYAPVIIASASTDSSAGPPMQLSIQCRRGRTDLVIASAGLTGRAEDQRVFYTVDDGQPVTLLVGPAASGAGLVIRTDVVRLLSSLPDQGEITFNIAGPQAAPLQGRYALGPLKPVLHRMARPCMWPVAAPGPPKTPPQ